MIASLKMALFLLLSSLLLSSSVNGHGTMMIPEPRQPESVMWYQAGCMIGCSCSGSGKEDYPSPESVECIDPATPTNTDKAALTFNVDGLSPRGSWNEFMPWRSPGSSRPIDSCGIASGFLPQAAVQYPHEFSASNAVVQGQKGTLLPPGPVTQWEAGSIVEASFYLLVNHGGGYQYRVCPKNGDNINDMNESCFEENPLVFADDVHTVVHGDKTIEIPATDVLEGVRPEGYAWRRIPLPACNCDSGDNCATISERHFEAAYAVRDSDTDTTSNDAYGNCPTGLQFVPPHIVDGLWPEGYGYYVSTLLVGTATSTSTSSNNGDKGGNNIEANTDNSNINSPCAIHLDATVCLADMGNNCKWYTEKNTCYATRGDGSDSSSSSSVGTKDDTTEVVLCSDQTSEAPCLAATEHGSQCIWYESAGKAVCYVDNDESSTTTEGGGKEGYDGSKERENSTGGRAAEWYITDRVYAPTEPGDYILQWRWDNEQTPQIWTTCADIQVVPEGQSIEQSSKDSNSSSSGTKELSQTAFYVSTLCLFLLALSLLPFS